MHQVDKTSPAKKRFGAKLLHNTIVKKFYHPKTESTAVPQKDSPPDSDGLDFPFPDKRDTFFPGDTIKLGRPTGNKSLLICQSHCETNSVSQTHRLQQPALGEQSERLRTDRDQFLCGAYTEPYRDRPV